MSTNLKMTKQYDGQLALQSYLNGLLDCEEQWMSTKIEHDRQLTCLENAENPAQKIIASLLLISCMDENLGQRLRDYCLSQVKQRLF